VHVPCHLETLQGAHSTYTTEKWNYVITAR
jgi:hypothetical protein